MSKMPTVSVGIPVYNAQKYLRQAIESILSQAFDDFELIISDDASGDESLNIAESFWDPRVSVCQNPRNIGMVGNWSRCLELARGRYICIFHDDDIMKPGNLGAKVKFLDANPGVGMVHSNVMIIDENGAVINKGWQNQPKTTVVEAPEQALRRMVRLNPVVAPTVLMRREAISQSGAFDPRFTFAVDWDMWLRIAARWEVGYIAEPLVFYRHHPGQSTETYLRIGETLLDEERVIMRFLGESAEHLKFRRTAMSGQASRAITQAAEHLRASRYRLAGQTAAYAIKTAVSAILPSSGTRSSP